MARHFSKKLVIDASVARAAGGSRAIDNTSKHCRDFLTETLRICHQMVLTSELRAEWRKHASRFSRSWQIQMLSRNKQILLPNPADSTLRNQILSFFDTNESARRAVEKDCHLIEAACSTDLIIISLNDRDRQRFAKAAGTVSDLSTIMWIDPCNENALEWLRRGARPDPAKRLKPPRTP